MDRRIFGIENEYAVLAYCGGKTLDLDLVAARLFEPLGSAQVFLDNGARLYNDMGSHPEYATPECLTVREVVTHDKAGERILEALAVELEEKLTQEMGKRVTVLIVKNNTDSGGNTYGAHENYSVPLERASGPLSLETLTDELTPFLVTRQLLCGAGKVLRTRTGVVYCFSQRAPHMSEAMSGDTTHDRALITYRDESHTDDTLYRRLHLIAGDSNMSETTTMLKMGSTDLILRMIEAGESFADLRLANPIRDMQRISRDISGCTRIRTSDGRKWTPLRLQQEYLRRVQRFAAARGIAQDPEVAPVLDLWQRTLRAIELKKPELVEREIDWAIKLGAIRRLQKQHPHMRLSHPRIAQLDVVYHDIRRTRGIYYRLEKAGRITRFTSDLHIFRAKTCAPETTRAYIRGDFLKKAKAAGVDHVATWDCVRLMDGPVREWQNIPDPFQTASAEVAAALTAMHTWCAPAGVAPRISGAPREHAAPRFSSRG